MNNIFNFSPGPAMLPHSVLEQAQQELCNWRNLHTSVMEVSHRGPEFIACAAEAEQDLRDLLSIPSNYKVLFCQAGARGQFMAVPLNILGQRQQADYIISGYWSKCAADEADQVCYANRINVIAQQVGKTAVAAMKTWSLSDMAAYIHYCPNETIDGVAIFEPPDFGDKIVVADYSSSILSQPIDVTKYGIIYASAQKNIGPSGITIVIVREDLLEYARNELPSVLNYKVLAETDSVFNTPPTFAWYLSGLVFKWLKQSGGLTEMAKKNKAKATLLYDAIDRSDFYHNPIAKPNRSLMNVPFTLSDSQLDQRFLAESKAAGLLSLKGHRIVGGMRASIYNAMPIEGVQTLVDFMVEFERRNG